MSVNDWIHTIAGTMILLTLALGVNGSPFFHSHYWLYFTAFVGLNLFQYGFTKFCPMAAILKAIGVKETR